MAEDKKPNLKDRLKKTTQVGIAPGPAIQPPASAPVSAPPGVSGHGSLPPPAIGGPPGGGMPGGPMPGIPGVPGIPGLGGDVAPPAFVQQQQAAAAAAAAQAERVRRAAENPFEAAASAPAGPQEVRLVFDDKPVDEKELGRKRTGLFIAIAATAVVAGAAGYLGGSNAEQNHQKDLTKSAVTQVRTSIQSLSDIVNAAKEKVDHAAQQAGIRVSGGGGDDAPQAQPDPRTFAVDQDLLAWFRDRLNDSQEPPLNPGVYATRVPRLTAEAVGKLTVVQLQTNEMWRLLNQHLSATQPDAVTNALEAVRGNGAAAEISRVIVTFAPLDAQHANDGLFAQLGAVQGQPQRTPTGMGVDVQINGVPGVQHRTIYVGGDITQANLLTSAVRVNMAQGLGPQVRAGAILPWVQYVRRLQEIKNVVDQLAQNNQQLLQMLGGGGRS